MKYIKKILCLVITLMITALMSSCSVQSKMSEPQPEPVNLSQPQPREREKRIPNFIIIVKIIHIHKNL